MAGAMIRSAWAAWAAWDVWVHCSVVIKWAVLFKHALSLPHILSAFLSGLLSMLSFAKPARLRVGMCFEFYSILGICVSPSPDGLSFGLNCAHPPNDWGLNSEGITALKFCLNDGAGLPHQ